MADGRRSKRVKLLHQRDDVLPAQKTKSRRRSNPTGVFHFLDLPKELRLLIYEFAFATEGQRKACIRIFETVHQTTRAMRPYENTTSPPHLLLLTCKFVFNEGISIFHRDTVFDVRLYLDKKEWSPRAHLLGKIPDCRFFSNIQHLQLSITLIEDMDHPVPFNYAHLLTKLTAAVGRSRKLATLDITFFYSWSDDKILHSSSVRPIMFALASLASTTRARVGWFDIETDDYGMEVPTWVPMEYRKMATELEDTVVFTMTCDFLMRMAERASNDDDAWFIEEEVRFSSE